MEDALTARAEKFLRTQTPVLIVSDFAAAEFAAAIARRVRIGATKIADARRGFSTFDVWIARVTERTQTRRRRTWRRQVRCCGDSIGRFGPPTPSTSPSPS